MNDCSHMTLLLQRASQGDTAAYNELFSEVYVELRGLAGWFIRGERPGHTLQPTALVHETYMRLLGNVSADWASRAHFIAVAAQVMRHILVDHARSRRSQKRSGSVPSPDFDLSVVSEEKLSDILAIDSVLSRLCEIDPRQAKIVEMRYFGGLTDEEIGLVLDTSSKTVKRDWKVAKAWLRAELSLQPQ